MQVKGLLYLENYLFGWPDGQITDSYLSIEVPWSKKFPGPVGFHSSTAGACARVCVCVRTCTCVLPQSSLAKLPNPAFFYCNPLISNGVCSSVLTNLIFLSSICTGTLCLSPQVIQVLRHQSQVCQKQTRPSSSPMSSLLSLPFRF